MSRALPALDRLSTGCFTFDAANVSALSCNCEGYATVAEEDDNGGGRRWAVGVIVSRTTYDGVSVSFWTDAPEVVKQAVVRDFTDNHLLWSASLPLAVVTEVREHALTMKVA